MIEPPRVEAMKSVVIKRSVALAGHKTSVSLEDAFWKGLKEIARRRDMTLSDLIASIDNDRHPNLEIAVNCPFCERNAQNIATSDQNGVILKCRCSDTEHRNYTARAFKAPGDAQSQ
jgi:predicted DNA-binding ribbon-helix-helix protein